VGFFFGGGAAITAAPAGMDFRLRTEANCMRKAALWAGVPAVAAGVGVVLWFALIPGRSGAG
jgi:hypothetical protein